MEQYNILIVEDDKEIRDGIEIFLKSQNYNVFKAADGVEGLEVMEREKISGDEFKIIMEGGELPPLEEPAEEAKPVEAPVAPQQEAAQPEADGENAPQEPAAPEMAQEQPGENPENQEPKL